MNLGEVFYWDTNKATGHASRFKYHVFICEADWQDGHTFLFINSSDYGGDYKITNPPYSFLTKPESYISCSGLVMYNNSELISAGPPIGKITDAHLQELNSSISGSFIMERRYIVKVCNALFRVF